MTTAGELITAASVHLHGGGSTQDRVTSLASDISSTDTQFTVTAAFGQAVGITPGVVEINGEQIYVQAVDNASGVCTLSPGMGRGYNKTTPTAHSAGSVVVSRPRFSRSSLLRSMNDVVGGLFPDLFVVKTYMTTVKFPSNTYTLPVAPQWVLDVQYLDLLNNWQRVHAFMVDPFDQALRLSRTEALIGRPLRILYAIEPSLFTAETDDYSVTGLPVTASDLLVLGTVVKQTPGLDIARAQTTSVEQSSRSRVVPPFAGVNASKYFMAEFKDRLQNEAKSLRRLYRPRIVRTW